MTHLSVSAQPLVITLLRSVHQLLDEARATTDEAIAHTHAGLLEAARQRSLDLEPQFFELNRRNEAILVILALAQPLS